MLTSADFLAVKTADPVIKLSPLANGWVSSLGTGNDAVWVGTNVNAGNNSYNSHSSLMDYAFNLVNGGAATLDLKFAVDDQFGDYHNEGLFLDGMAISGSKMGIWNQINTKSFSLGTLSTGEHHLSFDIFNSNGPSGMILSGTVSTQPVPEPATFAVIGCGLIGLISGKRKRA